ncbi:hypothetical protein [Oceanobacillus senegalensis]|uniref:hypothetical protein n=1 Tax=Oceanobacillus senegalensis TaxID=1936063 RepID=UPI000A309416|nr:hypothetical protein [Oceanobacillus senegalensis]
MKGYYKAIIGAIIGAATAGIWLTLDLILPEPFGDYLLFTLMGLVNMVIGWQVGRLVSKSEPSKFSTTGQKTTLNHADTIAEK